MMKGMIEALYKRLLLAAHPVGCVYQSTEATSPAELFGGKWEQITDRFLLAAGNAYKVGSVGGSASKSFELEGAYARIVISGSLKKVVNQYVGVPEYAYNRSCDITPITTEGTVSFGTPVVGGTKAASIMPPYFAVYMWRRTS